MPTSLNEKSLSRVAASVKVFVVFDGIIT